MKKKIGSRLGVMYLLNSTANPAHFHSNRAELAVLCSVQLSRTIVKVLHIMLGLGLTSGNRKPTIQSTPHCNRGDHLVFIQIVHFYF